MLVVYVDDFKLAGPKENLAKGWALIRQGLDVDDQLPLTGALVVTTPCVTVR